MNQPGPKVITLNGFLSRFLDQHSRQTQKPFCFILGAGASKQSDIKDGTALATQFLEEIYRDENFENLPFDNWATSERLGIPDFDLNTIGTFYPQLSSRRFQREDEGFAFLEAQMEGRDPSYGYSVLAYLLSETPHKIV